MLESKVIISIIKKKHNGIILVDCKETKVSHTAYNAEFRKIIMDTSIGFQILVCRVKVIL